MKKLFALTSILTLLLTSVPVLADGVDAAQINTFFYSEGFLSAYNEMTVINGGSEGIIEEIVAWGDNMLVVEKSGDYTYHHDWDYVSLNEDKEIYYEGDCHGCGELTVAKSVWWGAEQFGTADIYREAYVGDLIYDAVHVGSMGSGSFVDSIETNKDTYVYQSVGLDQFATCEDPLPPVQPDAPECEWCD